VNCTNHHIKAESGVAMCVADLRTVIINTHFYTAVSRADPAIRGPGGRLP